MHLIIVMKSPLHERRTHDHRTSTPLAEKWLPASVSRQKPEGRRSSEDSGAFPARATIGALKALNRMAFSRHRLDEGMAPNKGVGADAQDCAARLNGVLSA